MGLSHNPRIVTDGLVLCLDAANPKSYPRQGTTLFDLSGNNVDASLINNATYDNINQGAFVFDGISSRIERPGSSILATDGPVTISSVFRMTSNIAATIYRIQFGNESTYSLQVNTTGPYTQWWTTTNSRVTHQSTFTFNTNQNYCIAASIEPSNDGLSNTSKFYINGELIETINSSHSGTRRNSQGTLFIGSGTRGDGTPINQLTGEIYNTIFYKRILTDAEIKQNYNAFRGRYGL